MKKLIFLLCFTTTLLQAQSNLPTKAIDGAYKTLFKEKGPEGPTNDRLIQLAENNGTLMLAVAACERCFPAVFTYKKELSTQFGKPVFSNSFGYYVLTYDDNSFVIILLEVLKEADFSFSNFYSKDAVKVDTMTKEKIETYAGKILDFI